MAENKVNPITEEVFDENDEGAFRYWADCNSETSMDSRDSFTAGRRYEHKTVSDNLRAAFNKKIWELEKEVSRLSLQGGVDSQRILSLKEEVSRLRGTEDFHKIVDGSGKAVGIIRISPPEK